MAGYFISQNERVFSRVLKETKELFPYRKYKKLLGWNIAFFQKNNIADHKNIYEDGDNFIVGVGTYFYKNKFGSEALPLIYRDLIRNENPFTAVSGHFNFIIHRLKKLSIVTDKSGHYRALRADEKGQSHYSTSFILLCRALDRIRLARQESLEFINVAATFGGQTLVEDITHLRAGRIYDLGPSIQESYYYRMEDGNADFHEFVDRISSYFHSYFSAKLNVACDLSAGFDTRAVAAVLLFNGDPFQFFSNKRLSPAARDLEIARSIAERKGLLLREIDLEDKSHLLHDPGRIIEMTEMTRGLDVAYRMINETENKSRFANIIISGWGAEMLRNQHGRISKLDLNIGGFGYSRVPLPNKKATARYKQKMSNKFARDIEDAMGSGKMAIGERIYYLERGRHWSASVLSVRNRYCYWSYPFFDHDIAKYLFEFGKKDELFQRKFIDHFASELKDIPIWDAETIKAGTVTGKVKKWFKKIVPSRFMIFKPYFKRKLDLPDYSDSITEMNRELTEWLGFDAEYLQRHGAVRSVSKYQAISEFVNLFREKIDMSEK